MLLISRKLGTLTNVPRRENNMRKSFKKFKGNIPSGVGWDFLAEIKSKGNNVFYVYTRNSGDEYVNIKLVLEPCKMADKANYWIDVNTSKKCFTKNQQLPILMKRDYMMLEQVADLFGIKITRE